MKKEVYKIAEGIINKLKENPYVDVTNLSNPDHDTENLLKQEISKSPAEYQKRLYDEFFGNGPLDTILKIEDVNEIVLNGYNQIWYERGGTFHQHSEYFASPLTYHQFIYRLCKKLNSQTTYEEPFLCETHENLRFHISSPLMTQSDFCVCIRKHSHNRWTFKRLKQLESLTPQQCELVEKIILSKKNFLVVGSTGSGKTSFLNACLSYMNSNERIVILEDTNELITPNNVSTKLLTKKDTYSGIQTMDLSRLVKESLRMRPDRLVLGEVRGAEAKDLLMALATGHQGSFGTLHANNATEALLRLEMLIQLGAPQWSLEAIRKLIYLSIQYVICINKNEKGQRKISGIYKISGLESFGCLLDKEL